jgi:hypothetical protein
MELHKKFDRLREIGEWFTFGLADVKECIFLMRLVQESEPNEPMNREVEVVESDFQVSQDLETLQNAISGVDWSVRKVREFYPTATPEQLFESVSVAAESGESVRNIIKNILKCREGNDHKTAVTLSTGKHY